MHVYRAQLQDILASMASFTPMVNTPPIIDSPSGSSSNLNLGDSGARKQDAVKGMRALRDAVRRDLEVLDKVGCSKKYLDVSSAS